MGGAFGLDVDTILTPLKSAVKGLIKEMEAHIDNEIQTAKSEFARALNAAVTEAIGKVPAVTDVIVLPGLHAGYEAAPAERHWLTADELTGGDDTEPDRYVEDRDPLGYRIGR